MAEVIEFDTPRLRLRQWRESDRDPFAALNETISGSASSTKATRVAPSAASVANPLPQWARARRQPISTHGEKGSTRRGIDRPTKPAKASVSRTSPA